MMMQPLLSVSASELQTFIDAPEQLLQQSEELLLAIASFPDTPRNLLEILVNSPFEQVAEAAALHINFAGEAGDNWQQLVDDLLTSRQMGQNDRLVVELLKLGVVPPSFLSEWIPAEKLIQALHTIQMPLRSYQHRIVAAKAPTKERAIAMALQSAEMVVIEKTTVKYPDEHNPQLNQFMNKYLRDRTIYDLSFWDIGYTYDLGQTPTGDWIGALYENEFEYNP